MEHGAQVSRRSFSERGKREFREQPSQGIAVPFVTTSRIGLLGVVRALKRRIEYCDSGITRNCWERSSLRW